MAQDSPATTFNTPNCGASFSLLVIWAVAVWLLLVMMPGIQQIQDMTSAMLHLPNIFIGLGLIGAIFAAYNLRSDGHMLWFLGVLVMLAGWA
ncbi:MAG: hypothetical protein R3E95_04030 [Thiolinea sp.]